MSVRNRTLFRTRFGHHKRPKLSVRYLLRKSGDGSDASETAVRTTRCGLDGLALLRTPRIGWGRGGQFPKAFRSPAASAHLRAKNPSFSAQGREKRALMIALLPSESAAPACLRGGRDSAHAQQSDRDGIPRCAESAQLSLTKPLRHP
jgi:hypothetical protein